MTFLICVKCPCSCSIDTHDKEMLPIICGTDDGTLIRPEWLTPPQHKKKIRELYEDPMGEPYKAPHDFIQTPVINPIRPVMEAGPKTAEQLRKEKEESIIRFKLRTKR
jgi:hypothetical protein